MMKIAKTIHENLLSGTLATVSAGVMLVVSAPALAHHAMDGATPQTLAQGLLSGLAHPVIGLEHLAFLIIAMLLTRELKGTTRLLTPLVFVAATIGGTVIHLGAANIAMSETLVALSVLICGVLVVARRYPGALMLGAIFAVTGILHGYAYGEAIVGAESTPLLAYLVGFAAIQYALIVGGVMGFDRMANRSSAFHAVAVRVSSVVATLTGGVFLALSFS